MKYLIDDDLRDRLLTILTVTERWNTRDQISELKPLEPLTNAVIRSIWESDEIQGTKFGCGPFARAIESYILGVNKDE